MPSIDEINQGRLSLYRVSPWVLKVKEGWNGRDPSDPANEAHIDTLAQSIAKEGVREPLTVWRDADDGEFYVENGHCRLAACRKAVDEYGADEGMLVSVFNNSAKTVTESDRIMSQIVRNAGKPFSPLEQGRVFKRLKELEMSAEDIAASAGVSRVYVNDLTRLAEASPALTSLVRDDKVSATLAIEVLKSCDGDSKEATRILKEGLKVAKEGGADRVTKKHLQPLKKAKKVTPQAEPAETDAKPAAKKAEPKAAVDEEAPVDTLKLVRLILAEYASDAAYEDESVRVSKSDYEKLAELLEFEIPEYEYESDGGDESDDDDETDGVI